MTHLTEFTEPLKIRNRAVDTTSLNVAGIDPDDYPRFSEAYFDRGQYEDGTPLSDEDLEYLTDHHYWLLNQMAQDAYYDQAPDTANAAGLFDEELTEMKRLAGLPAWDEGPKPGTGRKKTMTESQRDRLSRTTKKSNPYSANARAMRLTQGEWQNKIKTPRGKLSHATPLRDQTLREGEQFVTRRTVGHEDCEARMMQRELLKIRDYAQDLCDMLDHFQDGDFPHWWQAKLVKAGDYMSSIKHFLEGEQELNRRAGDGIDHITVDPIAHELLGLDSDEDF